MARARTRLDGLPALGHEVDLWEAFDETLLGHAGESRRLLDGIPVETLDRVT